MIGELRSAPILSTHLPIRHNSSPPAPKQPTTAARGASMEASLSTERSLEIEHAYREDTLPQRTLLRLI